MFARADQLRIEDVEDRFRLHAIEYYWDDFEPKLLVFDVEDGQLREIDLHDLDLSVSKKRTCIGSFVGDEYVPCPNKMPVTKFAQCSDCAESFIPDQECVFEPKCNGEKCDWDFCKKQHSVYIAFFGKTPKVGMTGKNRVKRRLIEQGADAYFVVGDFPSRLSARTNEKAISEKMKITERSSAKLVLESLRIPKRREQIEEGWRWISEQLTKDFTFQPGNLEYLDSYPLEEPLDDIPRYAETWGMHSGNFVGIKGKYLIYKGEQLMALRLSDLPSRFLSKDLI